MGGEGVDWAYVWFVTRIITMICCVAEIFSAVFAFSFDPATMILNIYMIIFSMMILTIELSRACYGLIDIDNLFDGIAFLKRPTGKAIFLIFVGTIAFSSESVLGYAGGSCMMANGVFSLIFGYFDPEGGGGGSDGTYETVGDTPSRGWGGGSMPSSGMSMASGGVASGIIRSAAFSGVQF